MAKRLGSAPSGLFDLGRDEDHLSWSFERTRSTQAETSAGDGAIIKANEMPERLAVPVFPFDGDGFGRLQLQLIRCGGNTLATAFTTGELLVERLGRYQPWLGLPASSLIRVVNASVITGLVIDPAPSLVEAVWTREALGALRKVNDARF